MLLHTFVLGWIFDPNTLGELCLLKEARWIEEVVRGGAELCAHSDDAHPGSGFERFKTLLPLTFPRPWGHFGNCSMPFDSSSGPIVYSNRPVGMSRTCVLGLELRLPLMTEQLSGIPSGNHEMFVKWWQGIIRQRSIWRKNISDNYSSHYHSSSDHIDRSFSENSASAYEYQ